MSTTTTNRKARKEATADLIDTASPMEWKDWLSEIQAQIIRTGHCEGMTPVGSALFADRFLALQQFFSKLGSHE